MRLLSTLMSVLSLTHKETAAVKDEAKTNDEINKLCNEIDKLTAQCGAYDEAMQFADDVTQIAKLALWGTDESREKANKLLRKYNYGEGIWENWEKTKADLKSGEAMRRLLDQISPRGRT